MKILIFLVIASLSLSSSVEARLGETLEQCRVRYGKETRTVKKSGVKSFEKAGFMMIPFFRDGRVTEISFTHIAEGRRVPAEITAAEKQAILDANAGGSEWEVTRSAGFGQQIWKTKDGKSLAVYRVRDHTFLLLDRKALAKSNAEAAAREAENLKDF